ncbi:MAG: hypothetical protein JF570_07700 [Caulobacter sp.]|nr:hypothetical protein [Caulobacter sp.]
MSSRLGRARDDTAYLRRLRPGPREDVVGAGVRTIPGAGHAELGQRPVSFANPPIREPGGDRDPDEISKPPFGGGRSVGDMQLHWLPEIPHEARLGSHAGIDDIEKRLGSRIVAAVTRIEVGRPGRLSDKRRTAASPRGRLKRPIKIDVGRRLFPYQTL